MTDNNSITRPLTLAGLMAKIHVAKKQLALTDESYRDILRRITGKESCSEMTEGQLELVLAEFKRLGFTATKTSRRAKSSKMAGNKQARMIRAMWIELYEMGVVQDPSEKALSRYVARMVDVDDLHWITTKDAGIVINGLRGWIEREKRKAHVAS